MHQGPHPAKKFWGRVGGALMTGDGKRWTHTLPMNTVLEDNETV